MRNKITKPLFYGFLFSIFLFTLLFTASFVRAQEESTEQTKKSERWACLDVKWCLDDTAGCAQGRNGHRVKLSAKPNFKLLPNADTYIIECVSTATGPICTTGNNQLDSEVFQSNSNLQDLQASVGYSFQGMYKQDGVTSQTNPLLSNSAGDMTTVEWQSYTTRGTIRKFLALNYLEPEFASGSEGGQQQGTFDISNTASDCVSLRWDPYGTVFDSQSLEPIPGARVELFEKNIDTGVYTSVDLEGLVNPQTTKEDGVFNFVIPDGTYKLEVTRGGNHSFPADFDQIHPNANRVYSDLYPEPDPDGITPVPTGEPRKYDIVQVGDIQHRDIPMDPKSGQGTRSPVKLIDYFYQLANRYSSVLVVEGRASHPYTKIKVYTIASTADAQNGAPLRLIRELITNRVGKFKFEVDQSKLQPGEKFGTIVLEKQDLTSSPSLGKIQKFLSEWFGRLIGKVEAQESDTDSVTLNPIPNYIEGYAYDKSDNVLKNATVGVYLTFSQKPYYETKTDNEGYFRITSEYLPFLPYTLRYTSAAGAKSEVTTSDFLAQNDAVLKEKDIDPYVFKNSKGEVITGAPAQPGSNSGTNQNVDGEPSTDDTMVKPSSTGNILFVIVIILLLLGIAGILLGVYLMKKKSTPRI